MRAWVFLEAFEKTYKVHLVKLSHPMFLKNRKKKKKPSQDRVTRTKGTREDETVMVEDDECDTAGGTPSCVRSLCFAFVNGSSVAAPRHSQQENKKET